MGDMCTKKDGKGHERLRYPTPIWKGRPETRTCTELQDPPICLARTQIANTCSSVKSSCCSPREDGFSSQHLHGKITTIWNFSSSALFWLPGVLHAGGAQTLVGKTITCKHMLRHPAFQVGTGDSNWGTSGLHGSCFTN